MATRMQQRRGTASQWTSANPVLNAGEMGWESDTNKFKIGDGTNHWADLDYFIDINSTVNPSFGTSIVFEGATADSYETTLQVTDPTADRTITLPNVTGTVITTGNLSDITDIGVFSSTITMEGSTADDFELTLSAGDPTADRTITFPDATGTVQLRVTDVSDTEIGYLNGVTSAIQTQLDDKSTATKTETFTNKTLTSPKINENVDLTATATELNILDGATLSTTELNYVDGVTSAIQTQLDAKLALAGGTMTGAIAMGTSKITGLGTPTADADAATKAYVDAATAGLNVHASVQAATTANIALATDVENGDTLDGVTLATGNRILVKNQTTKTENGIYVVKASGAPDRADDYNSNPEVDAGDFIFVEAGTANGKTGWMQTNVITTVGSDNIEFTQFSGAGTYSAGNGITLTGTTFSIDTSITQARVADVSDTEIGYLNGVTSSIQTQLDDKSTASKTETLTNKTITSPLLTTPILRSPEERLSVSATAATGTVAFDVLTSGILYYTSNASANWTLNVRGSSGATLNDSLATNDSVTVVFFVTNGGTPYYQTGFQIDGSAVTPKWQNGTAPSAGNANSIDIYSYTIVKTGNAAFTAFGSQTKFA